MKNAYRVLATLVAAGVAVQLAFIAFGAFGVAADAEDGKAIDAAYSNLGQDLHGIGGMVIGVLVLVLLVVSFFARVPRGRALAVALVGLVALQYALATVAFGLPAVGALHGLNALAIAAVASTAIRKATTAGGERAEPAAKPEPVAGA